MATTKDQKDLLAVLDAAKEARGMAYSLLKRRLDTQRNVEAFILLRDATVLLHEACDALQSAVPQATETKSSDQLSVVDEIMVRSGRLRIVEDKPTPTEKATPGVVLELPKKKPPKKE